MRLPIQIAALQIEPFRQVLAEANPIRVREATAREPGKIHQQAQRLSVMPSRDVHIDDAHRRISQHINLEDLALDRDAANRAHRPEELAHALYPRLLLTPAVLAASSSPRSTAEGAKD